MPTTLRWLVNDSILYHLKERANGPFTPLEPEQIVKLYNQVWDEVSVTLLNQSRGALPERERKYYPWFQGEDSSVPENQVDTIRKLINSIVFLIVFC